MNESFDTKQKEHDIYIGLDIFKLICAILIVYMHTYCFDLGQIGYWIKETLSSVAVPFFFITSGFLYTKGLMRTTAPKSYFKRYIIRIITMYSLWSLITIPVSIYNLSMVHDEYTIIMKCLYVIRSFLFSGSMGVYWYLLSLIYLSIIIYFTFRYKVEKFVLPLSICLFAVGVLYNAEKLDNTIIYTVIHTIFGSERNFLTVGFMYMMIVFFIAKYKNNKMEIPLVNLIIAFILAIISEIIIIYYTKLYFMRAITAIILFFIALKIKNPNLQTKSKTLRKLSTAIYLEHFPFIIVFDFYLKRGTIIDFCVTLAFSITLYIILKKLLSKRITDILYGN